MEENRWRERLEQVRRALGWSYRRMGDYFGVSDAAVIYWVQGRNPIPETVKAQIEMLEAIANRRQQVRNQENIDLALKGGALALAVWFINELFQPEEPKPAKRKFRRKPKD